MPQAASASSSLRFAARRRATSATAAAPNNSIIGGAGTGVGSLDELLVLPPELDEEELDEELLLDEDELVLPVEPKLLLPPAIGGASCRERARRYGSISVVDVSL